LPGAKVTPVDKSSKLFCFELTEEDNGKKVTYCLAAKSKEDYEDWLEAIQVFHKESLS
jgi:hypothetical protein